MSRFSAISPLTGRYEDIVCRKHPQGRGWYSVYLGTFPLGTVSFGGRSHKGWDAIAAVGTEMLQGMRSASGFRTRWDGIEYLLQVAGIHGQDRRTSFADTGGGPLMSAVCADRIEKGEVVTVCRIPGTDLHYARAHDPHDPATRPAPPAVHTLGVEHYIDELVRRSDERRSKRTNPTG